MYHHFRTLFFVANLHSSLVSSHAVLKHVETACSEKCSIYHTEKACLRGRMKLDRFLICDQIASALHSNYQGKEARLGQLSEKNSITSLELFFLHNFQFLSGPWRQCLLRGIQIPRSRKCNFQGSSSESSEISL